MTRDTATVTLFAAFREAAGTGDLEVAVEPGEPVIDVVRRAVEDRDGLQERVLEGGELRDHVNVVVDGESVGPEAGTSDCDEIALFPPMSGG